MVPRIDVEALVAATGSAAEGRTQRELHRACTEIGFATIVGHGVPDSVVAGIQAAAREFFALPDADKRSIAARSWNPESERDYRGYFPSTAAGKEGLDISDPEFAGLADAEREALLARPYYEPNIFPKALGRGFHRAIEDYYAALCRLGNTLLVGIARSLGGDATPIVPAFERPRALSTLRFNYYPADTRPAEISRSDRAPLACEEHTDSGILTILHQDDRGGLQVRDASGTWRDVPHEPGAFVVNTGQALDTLSRGAFRATAHRVLHAREERLSVPFFFEPRWDTPIGAATLGLAGPTARENYEEFLLRRLQGFAEYAHRGDDG